MSDDDKNPAQVSGVSEQKKRSRAGGRPGYKPTADHRSLVLDLVGKDATRREIADKLNVSPVTLRKYFAVELGERTADRAGQLDLGGTATSAPAAAPAAPAPIVESGRPEFEPNYIHREQVKLAKGDNWSDERIARLLKISRNTLLKYFAHELEQGADELRMEVLRDLKAASRKGSRPACEAILNLKGMIAPLEKLSTPDEDSAPAAKPLGKKAQAEIDAHKALEGTTWAELVPNQTRN